MTRKILSVFLFIVILSILAPNAKAQNAVSAPTEQAVTTMVQNGTGQTRTMQSGVAQNNTEAATKLREQMMLVQEQKNKGTTQAAQIRNEIKTKAQQEREEFKANLETIKDQRKKTLLANIDEKINQTNQRYTTRLTEKLNLIQTFLDKIESSTKSGTVVNTKTAQAAIESAKTAITVQAAKAYTITIVDETTLRTRAGAAISQLRTDLAALHKLVVNAKQAVQKLNAAIDVAKKDSSSSAKL